MSYFLVVGCPACRTLQIYNWRAKSLKARKRCVRCGKSFAVDISGHTRHRTAQAAREALVFRTERQRRFTYVSIAKRHKPCFGSYNRECYDCHEEAACRQISGEKGDK